MEFETLYTLAEKHGTDKLGHGYISFYERVLPKKCRTFLEIGVAHGASAMMWSDFYGADELDLHLIDLFINPEFVSARWARNRGFVPHKGDQGNIDFLYTIKEIFDVVVDDGSHNSQDVLKSFKHIFLNNCISGGIYVVEDMHCSKDSFYWGDRVKSFEDTPLWMFKNYLETGKIVNPYFEHGEPETFESIIDSVEIYNDQIVMIKRK